MKASTLFGLTIAILLGLGAVIVAKMLGVFDEDPVVEKEDPTYQIVVAKSNLFEGLSIRPQDVEVRTVRGGDEKKDFESNRSLYLPGSIGAAVLRIPNRNISAGTPIREDYLYDLELPRSPIDDLQPGMRSVNLGVAKDRANGGLISQGDRVDVQLTSTVSTGQDSPGVTRTAVIARNLRVINKRDQLFPSLGVNSDDKPLKFTLEANPYRAALIQHAVNFGDITLVPQRTDLTRGSPTLVAGDSLPEGEEFQEDQTRSDALLRGEMVVGGADLERVFKLKPPTVIPPAQPREKIIIEKWSGASPAGSQVFHKDDGTRVFDDPKRGNQAPGKPIVLMNFGDQRPIGYQFTDPTPEKDNARR